MQNLSKSRKANTFLDMVQTHERSWGEQSYLKRPSLDEILKATVVVFWYPTSPDVKSIRYTITLHRGLPDIEQSMLQFLYRSMIQAPERRIAKIFVEQKEVRIKRISLMFEPVES